MAVISSAFGQVKLTGDDAKKFHNQVTYGKPKAAASKTVKSGTQMFRDFQKSGGLKVKVHSASGR